VSNCAASAHIEFTQNSTLRKFVLKPAVLFAAEADAETHIISQAKQWIDNRLDREAIYSK